MNRHLGDASPSIQGRADLDATVTGDAEISMSALFKVLGGSSFEPLVTAMRNRHTVRFRFLDVASGGERERLVDPWGLGSKSGRWWLVGYDLDSAAQSIFPLDLITNAVLIDNESTFKPPQDFDVRAALNELDSDVDTPASAPVASRTGRAHPAPPESSVASGIGGSQHLKTPLLEAIRRRDEILVRSAAALTQVLTSISGDLEASPQITRSLQATENRWRRIEREFGMLDSGEVAELLGASPSNRNKAHQLAKDGQILGVKRGRGILYPGFQFDKELGVVRGIIKQVADIARRSGWEDTHVLLWFVSPNGFLGGTSPVHALTDGDQILEAARQDFGERW